jgi:hypothetical protein
MDSIPPERLVIKQKAETNVIPTDKPEVSRSPFIIRQYYGYEGYLRAHFGEKVF